MVRIQYTPPDFKMDFFIDEKYITDEVIHQSWGMFDHIPPDELTHEQLIKIIKGEDRCGMTSHRDHLEFTKLRNQLEELGYIKTERGWNNGDIVLKKFTLNGFQFKKDSRFPCAIAMKVAMEYATKIGRKTII